MSSTCGRAAAACAACKAGRYRTPFGIWAAGDHGYLGFLRPPLVRYGGYYALSSGYLEHGVAVTVGVAAAVARGERRPSRPTSGPRCGATASTRCCAPQVAHGPVIAGVSYIDTMPDQPARFAKGRAHFGGVDLRVMHAGVMLRGEWISGRPFDGTATRGGYLDVLVHRPRLGPVTVLARAERLAYDARPPHALYTHRYTAGARVRIWRGLAAAAGVVHQAGQTHAAPGDRARRRHDLRRRQTLWP